jgi:hypothetical protein
MNLELVFADVDLSKIIAKPVSHIEPDDLPEDGRSSSLATTTKLKILK